MAEASVQEEEYVAALAGRLYDWAVSELGMNYHALFRGSTPRVIPVSRDLEPLCRSPAAARVWEYVLGHVRSESTIETVRGNLELLGHSPVPRVQAAYGLVPGQRPAEAVKMQQRLLERRRILTERLASARSISAHAEALLDEASLDTEAAHAAAKEQRRASNAATRLATLRRAHAQRCVSDGNTLEAMAENMRRAVETATAAAAATVAVAAGRGGGVASGAAARSSGGGTGSTRTAFESEALREVRSVTNALHAAMVARADATMLVSDSPTPSTTTTKEKVTFAAAHVVDNKISTTSLAREGKGDAALEKLAVRAARLRETIPAARLMRCLRQLAREHAIDVAAATSNKASMASKSKALQYKPAAAASDHSNEAIFRTDGDGGGSNGAIANPNPDDVPSTSGFGSSHFVDVSPRDDALEMARSALHEAELAHVSRHATTEATLSRVRDLRSHLAAARARIDPTLMAATSTGGVLARHGDAAVAVATGKETMQRTRALVLAAARAEGLQAAIRQARTEVQRIEAVCAQRETVQNDLAAQRTALRQAGHGVALRQAIAQMLIRDMAGARARLDARRTVTRNWPISVGKIPSAVEGLKRQVERLRGSTEHELAAVALLPGAGAGDPHAEAAAEGSLMEAASAVERGGVGSSNNDGSGGEDLQQQLVGVHTAVDAIVPAAADALVEVNRLALDRARTVANLAVSMAEGEAAQTEAAAAEPAFYSGSTAAAAAAAAAVGVMEGGASQSFVAQGVIPAPGAAAAWETSVQDLRRRVAALEREQMDTQLPALQQGIREAEALSQAAAAGHTVLSDWRDQPAQRAVATVTRRGATLAHWQEMRRRRATAS